MFLRPPKLRANRSCAILELIYFGPISEVIARISIQALMPTLPNKPRRVEIAYQAREDTTYRTAGDVTAVEFK